MKHFKCLGVALVAALTLAACGGGGGSAGKDPFANGTTTPVPVTPTQPGAATPAALLLTLSSTAVKDTDTQPVAVTAQVVNGSGQAIADAVVSFSAALNSGAVISGGGKTDSSGKVTASIDYSSSRANRVITVTATVGTLKEQQSFTVSGAKISSTPSPAIVTVGAAGSVEFAVGDANSNGLAATDISISSNLGTPVTSAKTGSDGKYLYNYTVPAGFTSANVSLVVVAAGVSQQVDVPTQQVSAPVDKPVNPATIGTTDVTANPSVIETNSDGGTQNKTTITFKAFTNDATPLAMDGIRVSFDLNGDPGQVGGSFTSGSNVLYTDARGVASTTYVPGVKATGTDGLSIRACYAKTNFTPSPSGTAVTGSAACPNAKVFKLTINNEALNVTIGQDDTIALTPDGLRYVVKFAVQVANASGQAKSNVLITPTLDLPGYGKGAYLPPNSPGNTTSKWVQVSSLDSSITYPDVDNGGQLYAGCRNEDVNRDGIRSAGEDIDNDGVLEPRKSDAAVSFIDSTQTKTDNTGFIGLQVTFLKTVATWLRVKVYVKGAVSGTEGTGSESVVLPAPTSAITGQDTPAFAVSPYGFGTACNIH